MNLLSFSVCYYKGGFSVLKITTVFLFTFNTVPNFSGNRVECLTLESHLNSQSSIMFVALF